MPLKLGDHLLPMWHELEGPKLVPGTTDYIRIAFIDPNK